MIDIRLPLARGGGNMTLYEKLMVGIAAGHLIVAICELLK